MALYHSREPFLGLKTPKTTLECPNTLMKSTRWLTSCKIHISYDIRVLKRCSSRYLVPNAQPTLLPDLPDSPGLRDFRWVHTPLMNLSNVLYVLGGDTSQLYMFMEIHTSHLFMLRKLITCDSLSVVQITCDLPLCFIKRIFVFKTISDKRSIF